MDRVIYTQSSGVAAVIIPAPDCGLTIEEIAAKDVPQGTAYKIVDVSEVPSDRTYRNAWVADLVAGKINHDMPKAKELHRQKMRDARTPLLSALDVEYQRADEANNQARKQQIAQQKQQLRDVTADPGIAAAQTVEQLKAVWPAVLGPNPLV